LKEALEVARGRVRVVIDLKEATSFRVVDRIMREVEGVSMEAEVAVISGRLDALTWVRIGSGTIPIGLYVAPPEGAATYLARNPGVFGRLSALGYAEIFLRTEEVDRAGELYQAALTHGVPIGVWTVRDRAQLASMLEAPGVTRVLTDVLP
jgi:glycerophosphoryl diester phosphodiesterase